MTAETALAALLREVETVERFTQEQAPHWPFRIEAIRRAISTAFSLYPDDEVEQKTLELFRWSAQRGAAPDEVVMALLTIVGPRKGAL